MSIHHLCHGAPDQFTVNFFELVRPAKVLVALIFPAPGAAPPES
jgi:hypothetical protein